LPKQTLAWCGNGSELWVRTDVRPWPWGPNRKGLKIEIEGSGVAVNQWTFDPTSGHKTLIWKLNNNNEPFIDLKCTYNTRRASHCKYSCDRESEVFTTDIDIVRITNITYELNYNLGSERRDALFQWKPGHARFEHKPLA